MVVRQLPHVGTADLDQVLTLDMLHVSDGFGVIRPDSTYGSSNPHGRRLHATGEGTDKQACLGKAGSIDSTQVGPFRH